MQGLSRSCSLQNLLCEVFRPSTHTKTPQAHIATHLQALPNSLPA